MEKFPPLDTFSELRGSLKFQSQISRSELSKRVFVEKAKLELREYKELLFISSNQFLGLLPFRPYPTIKMIKQPLSLFSDLVKNCLRSLNSLRLHQGGLKVFLVNWFWGVSSGFKEEGSGT